MRTILLGLIALPLFLAAVVWVPGDVAASSRVTVILVDTGEVQESTTANELTRSTVGLISAFIEESLVVGFVIFSDKIDTLGPYLVRSPQMRQAREHVQAELDVAGVSDDGSLAVALSEALNVLEERQAAESSEVYIISGGPQSADIVEQKARVASSLQVMAERQWIVHSVILPNTSPRGQEFMEFVALSTGGEAYNASSAHDLKLLSERLMSGQEPAVLSFLGQRDMPREGNLSTGFVVALGTQKETILLYREDPSSVLKLVDPFGREFTSELLLGQGATIEESPRLLAWTIADPAPGSWQTKVEGSLGQTLLWHRTVNTIRIVFESSGSTPVDEPMILSASVWDGDRIVVPEGAKLVARIASPSGAVMVHELSDDGQGADRAAGDGYFATRIPPVKELGDHVTTLQLTWPQYDITISSSELFQVEAFPQITIEPAQPHALLVGRSIKLADVFVNVRGEPFPLPTTQLSPVVDLPNGSNAIAQLEPVEPFEEGTAWKYQVLFIPGEPGVHVLNFQLRMEFLGRNYTYSAEPIALNVSVAPVVLLPSDGIPYWAWAAVASAVLLATILLIWMVRTPPYGYLYDDREQALVNFSRFWRNPLRSLVFKSTVKGSELKITGLEGVVFRFTRKGVRINYDRITPSLRINNHPVTGSVPLEEKTWIGTQGKLYSFHMIPLPQPSPVPPPVSPMPEGSVGNGGG